LFCAPLYVCFFSLPASGAPRALHSFPTRRSSDLHQRLRNSEVLAVSPPVKLSEFRWQRAQWSSAADVKCNYATAGIVSADRGRRSEERRVGKEWRSRWWAYH